MSPNPELESDLPFDNTFGLSEEDIRGPSVFLDRLYAAMARHALSSFRKRDSLVARGPRRNKTMQELEDDFVASGKQDEEEVGDSEGDSDIEIISKGPSSEINNGRVLKEIIELSAASGTGTSTGTGTGTGTGKSKKTHRNTSSTSSNPPVPPRPTGLRGNTKRSFYDPSADSSSKRKTPKKTDVDSDEGSDTGKQPPVLPPWKKPDPTLSDSSSSEENEPDVELPVQTKTKKAAKPKTPKGPLTGHDENVSTGMATEREKALNKELNELRQQMQQQMEQQLQHQLQMQQQLQQLHQQTHPQLIVPAATAKTAATAAATTAAAATAERVAAAEAKVAAETAAKLQKQQEDQHDQFMRMKSQQSTLAVSLGLPLLGSGAAATEGTVTEKLDLSFAGVFESFTAQLGRANKALSKVVQDDINNRTVTTMADLRGKRTIKSFSQQTEHVSISLAQ
jgi:FKBP-type peptidyl-prolyl cis-trans isomerase